MNEYKVTKPHNEGNTSLRHRVRQHSQSACGSDLNADGTLLLDDLDVASIGNNGTVGTASFEVFLINGSESPLLGHNNLQITKQCELVREMQGKVSKEREREEKSRACQNSKRESVCVKEIMTGREKLTDCNQWTWVIGRFHEALLLVNLSRTGSPKIVIPSQLSATIILSNDRNWSLIPSQSLSVSQTPQHALLPQSRTFCCPGNLYLARRRASKTVAPAEGRARTDRMIWLMATRATTP